MSIIDHLASIPYRIFGVLIILLCIIVGIPLIIIPIMLYFITQGLTFKQVEEISNTFFGELSLKEMFEVYKQANNGWLNLVGLLLDKTLLGISMVLCGIYYDEIYEEVINLK